MPLFSPKQREALATFAEAAKGSPDAYRVGMHTAIKQAAEHGREATAKEILAAIKHTAQERGPGS